MTGFLHAHGTSPCISGYFLPSSAFDEQDEPTRGRAWASVEDLLMYDPYDEDFLEERFAASDELADVEYAELAKLDTSGRADLMESPYWDFETDREPVQYADIKEWYYATMSEETAQRLAAETAAIMAAEQLEEELEVADKFAPSFYGRNRTNDVIDWCVERFTWPRRNYGRKLAKWRGENGRRARKDVSYRWSIRHMQMQVFEQFYVDHIAERFLNDNARFNLN